MENQQEQAAQGYPQSSTITGMNSQKQPSQSSSSPVMAAQQPQLHHLLQQQQQQLQLFWNYQRQEIEQVTDFKNHQLPLARIKKIMKADEDVRMISAEAPVLFAKACEFFILELTIRAWLHAEENKRRTLQKNDIAAAITRTDIFDFLVDIVPRDETKDEGMSSLVRPGYVSAAPAADIPYYYPPAANAGVTIGRPAMAMGDPSMYYQAAPVAGGMQYGVPRQPWQQVWQPSQPEPQTFMGNVPAQESTGDDQGQGYDVSNSGS